METAARHSEVALQNILVATDFSSTSEKALQYAVAIATRYHSNIQIVHVIEPTAVEFLARKPCHRPTSSCTMRQRNN